MKIDTPEHTLDKTKSTDRDMHNNIASHTWREAKADQIPWNIS